jgi:hypothetical protein
VLAAGALLFGHYPLLLGLAQDATLYWVASVGGGLVWALLSGGLINRLMERVPEDDRPAHMTLHNLVLNLGILAGSGCERRCLSPGCGQGGFAGVWGNRLKVGPRVADIVDSKKLVVLSWYDR